MKIEISEKTWALIKRNAEPYQDKTPDDTLRRVLLGFEETKSAGSQGDDSVNFAKEEGSESTADVEKRAPRERGVRVRIAGEIMIATSVADLYGQVLRFLVKKHKPAMKSLIPIRTSSARFLLADKPVHPNGNGFVRPVEYDGFFLESHKDYKNALAHLEQLAKRVGEPLEYLGN